MQIWITLVCGNQTQRRNGAKALRGVAEEKDCLVQWIFGWIDEIVKFGGNAFAFDLSGRGTRL